MNETELNESAAGTSIAKLPAVAAIVALGGLADSTYLTIHHLTAEPVPCSIIAGCETVLTSPYAEIGGVPLAAFGAAAYFTAFSLALFTAFGNHGLWKIYGVQATLMAAVSLYLIYVQYFLIHAWCQYCLVSAAISFTLFLLYIVSIFVSRRRHNGASR